MKRWISLLLAAVMMVTGIFAVNCFADSVSEGQTFISLLNQKRAAQGLVTLGVDGELMDAAAIRAKEQSVRLSHYRPDGARWRRSATGGSSPRRTAPRRPR